MNLHPFSVERGACHNKNEEQAVVVFLLQEENGKPKFYLKKILDCKFSVENNS